MGPEEKRTDLDGHKLKTFKAMGEYKFFAHRFEDNIETMTIKKSGRWNKHNWGNWNARWSRLKTLRVIGKDCQFAIEDRCPKKGHRRRAIVIEGGSNCLRKHLGLSTKCLGRAFKLAM